MTESEAAEVVRTVKGYYPYAGARMVRCPDKEGFGVAIPASDSENDLWFLIRDCSEARLETIRCAEPTWV